MSDYIVEAIKNGVWETLRMTAYASLYAYIVGLPVGVILYATAKGRLPHFTRAADPVHAVGDRLVHRDDGGNRAAHGRSNPDRGADGGGLAV